VGGDIISTKALDGTGHDETLRHPCLYLSWRRHFAFYRSFQFYLGIRRASKLMFKFYGGASPEELKRICNIA
jgi:hypothetical protein